MIGRRIPMFLVVTVDGSVQISPGPNISPRWACLLASRLVTVLCGLSLEITFAKEKIEQVRLKLAHGSLRLERWSHIWVFCKMRCNRQRARRSIISMRHFVQPDLFYPLTTLLVSNGESRKCTSVFHRSIAHDSRIPSAWFISSRMQSLHILLA